MRRIALVAIAALLLAGFCATTAMSESTTKHTLPPSCTAPTFRAFSAAVWNKKNWERGAPPAKIIRNQRERLACAPPGHRAAMKHRWATDKHAYYSYRTEMLFHQRWTPYYGCTVAYPGITLCAYSAIDIYIVQCESGGDYTPEIPGGLNFGGKYGLLDKTYHEYGGRFNHANEGPPKEQDRIARELFENRGYSPWACA